MRNIEEPMTNSNKRAPVFKSGKVCLASLLVLVLNQVSVFGQTNSSNKVSAGKIEKGLTQAVAFYSGLAVNGGYVYFYSPDGKTRRLGEGFATPTQVWVQPPGTPTVGEAFLDAHEATGNPQFLVAASYAGTALAYGQLKSGGWTNMIDFDPSSKSAGLYRNGKGRGKNNSSLDDDQTGAALRFLIRLDHALKQQNRIISECVQIGLTSLLNAQFPNGAFPQVWNGPVEKQPIVRAQFPDYDWKTENRIKNYWDLYTINDNVTGSVARTLIVAHQIYGEDKYLESLKRLGQFLVLAQMPDPQPGWAQQYDYQMRPVWARRFEPPAVCSDETQETINTLMLISAYTSDKKFLAPIPSALRWLKKCAPEGQELARYYELKTNRPLYMNRNGKNYFLTYSDKNLPSHYGWKIGNRVKTLDQRYADLSANKFTFQTLLESIDGQFRIGEKQAMELVESLDDQGRWKTQYQGERLVGQPKFEAKEQYLSSRTFANNVRKLSRFLQRTKSDKTN